MANTIKLQADSIFQVPIQIYPNDFTFIVNGKQIETNKITADLLSTKISKLHQADPTLSEYFITTKSKGSFQSILNLLNFKEHEISEDEIPFISEIIQDLCIEKFDVNIQNEEISLNNVFELISKHDKNRFLFSTNLSLEVDFLSEHFYELDQSNEKKLFDLSESTIKRIILNDKIRLNSEDQLFEFIQNLCNYNPEFYWLHEHVYFKHLSEDSIRNFFNAFKFEYMTSGIWGSLSKRFTNEKDEPNSERYKKIVKGIQISKEPNNLKGIIGYLRDNSNINDEVNVIYSSVGGYSPDVLLDIENNWDGFYTKDIENSWIGFEFKKRRIIPSSYTIKSKNGGVNGCHLKSWVIEVSNDSQKWQIIDEQSNCSLLNGKHLVHTFPISNEKIDSDQGFKHVRLRQTGTSWCNNHRIHICAIELYGQIID